jgi:hypothetical protein
MAMATLALVFLWSPPTERRCRNRSTGTVSAHLRYFHGRFRVPFRLLAINKCKVLNGAQLRGR